ncbi:MAG TPA: restriction endonuclease subunit S, partial [Polyangium sp.]|nr:restriction endonuclease subunit S [Polyangium sp.]
MSGEELPEGWAISKLPEVFEINPPKPSLNALAPEALVSFVPMPAVDAALGAIVDGFLRSFAEVRKGYTAFADNDVILAKITPCFENGKAAVARNLANGLGFGSSEFFVFRGMGAVLPDYLFHFIRQQRFRDDGAARMNGAVGQARIPSEFLRATDLPIPPLAEQRRIVEKVEALLEQVNRMKGRLERTSAILKRFRQSVLAAACSGELTAEWRASNPASTSGTRPIISDDVMPEVPDSWGLVRFGSLVASSFYGPRFSADQYADDGIPTVRTTDMDFRGNITVANSPKVQLSPADISKYCLHDGDLLVTRTGATIGKCAVYSAPLGPALPSAYLIRFRLQKTLVSPTFALLYLQSPIGQTLLGTGQTSVAQPNVNARVIEGFPCPLPPLTEQHEIVRQVNRLFTLADTIEHRVNIAMARVEKLPQAILSKAFSGELVPTEAELARLEGRTYETAEALLARVRNEAG